MHPGAIINIDCWLKIGGYNSTRSVKAECLSNLLASARVSIIQVQVVIINFTCPILQTVAYIQTGALPIHVGDSQEL